MWDEQARRWLVHRRDILRQLAALGVWAISGPVKGQEGIPEGAVRPLFTVPAQSVSPYSERSKYAKTHRYLAQTPTQLSSWSYTPLEHLQGPITHPGLHFERHHAGIPDIDPEDYRLLIHGMVDKPRMYTLSDLMRFPATSVLLKIECSGNSLSEYGPLNPNLTAGQIHGLVSGSVWTGVRLSTLLREVGIKPGAKWIIAEGGDAAAMTRSIPLEKAFKDVLVAYLQNGDVLYPPQGFPVRLIVPGYEGNMHVKWLRRLEVTDTPAYSREETSKYTDLLPDGRARIFTYEMDVKSVITFPSGGQVLPDKGFWEIRGYAWSGRGRIKRVEVSTDGGKTWQIATLDEPVLPIALTQFRLPWKWNGEETVIMSRAVDELDLAQPSRAELLKARTPYTFYHYNAIQAWHIDKEGRVSNIHIGGDLAWELKDSGRCGLS